MVSGIILNHRSFSASMRRMEVDLRAGARRIVRDIADEMVEEGIREVSSHSKTGNMTTDIHSYSKDGWTKIVDFGDSQFLDSGSEPHAIPWSVAEEMAPYYGMTPGQFFGMIKKYGTEAHPFIDSTYETVVNRIDTIIQRELDRTIR